MRIKLENFVKPDSTSDVKSGIILHILLKISTFIPEYKASVLYQYKHKNALIVNKVHRITVYFLKSFKTWPKSY